MKSIISKAEAKQILRNDLLKRALEQHSAELRGLTPDQRHKLMTQIEQEVEREFKRQIKQSRFWWGL